MENVLALILGGGRGTRLYPLTKLRSKPAVPLAGKYRLIDIPISYVEEDAGREIMILSGDQIYRMDFRQLVKTHRDNKADVTIAVIPVAAEQASGLGILQLDETGRVIGFVEKPQTAEQVEPLRTPAEWLKRRGVTSPVRNLVASMGIYLFNRGTLQELLQTRPLAVDFGREIFPRSIRTHRVQAHLFDGYWEDVGTIKSYHEANIALAAEDPPFDFHSAEGVIYTRMRFLPASRVSGATLSQCLVSDGCVIQAGTAIERSVIGVRSRIGKNVTITDTVIVGADRFETDTEREENRRHGFPDLTVGDGSVIERAILDKDCRIGRNVQIVNRRRSQDVEADNYVVRDGIVVIPKGAVVRDGTVI
jgi:glucose-1-phosphate adenylyltransferase